MKRRISEGLPPAIPEYPVEIAGQSLTLRFDVNINKTKKGVKLQFIMKEVPEDPRKAQDLANAIGTELQQKFASADMQIIYDTENPYKNVVGFLLPLPSLAEYIMKHVLKGEEEAETELPAKEEEPVDDQSVKEVFMQRAGIS
jgi:hypothetical protein